VKTILLLIASNFFMTVAWYGHLKFKSSALIVVILLSWLIALAEYALQVPANRIGSEEYRYTATQLKVIQEVISLAVFAVFAFFYFKEVPTWRTLLAFGLIVAAALLVMPQAFDANVKEPAATTPE
jgi:uncharacterized protein (DUF486 family)